MAYRRYSLPPLKVTQRPTIGPKTTSSLYRVVNSQGDPDPAPPVELHTPSLDDTTATPVPGSLDPTEHELSCRASVTGWEKIRTGIRIAVTENAAMPLGQLCVICDDTACLRCQQCGPLSFFCSQCYMKFHSRVNIFHVAEKWEVII